MTTSVDVALTRVLPAEPYASLSEYVHAGGGEGLRAAGTVSADTIIEELAASGLRGRGGAGFPTGVKWRTIRSFASPVLLTSIVVNAAEGEPGTFKDRAIIRANPYAVIEGALIAARAMDSRSVVIATKAGFSDEVARLRAAAAEISAADWVGEVDVRIVEGPDEYLYGEETALLEVIDGRPPFPRIAPPFRRGIVEVVSAQGEADSGSGLPATVQLAGTGESSVAPPTLVDNVETMANIPGIIARGAAWFRSVGTTESPGTIVCTVTGDVRRPGVAELPMGTLLREAIDRAGGGVEDGQRVAAVLVGVSNAVLTEAQLDTKLTYEAMTAAGSGLGSAGFIVVGEGTPPISLAAGVSRFLAVESCGQCTACKQDGAEIAALLAGMARGEAEATDLATVRAKLDTITTGSICGLATQHQVVVGSLLDTFAAEISIHVEPSASAVELRPISALIGLDDSGEQLDTRFVDKQLDWTYDESDSGKTPVERFTDHRGRSPTTLDG